MEQSTLSLDALANQNKGTSGSPMVRGATFMASINGALHAMTEFLHRESGRLSLDEMGRVLLMRSKIQGKE